MTKIDYSTISWESFEHLCSALWFDEGYTKIQPLGGYKDRGRDALCIDADRGELVIFQYKRWAGYQSPSRFKRFVKKAVDKITGFNPQKYILNTTQKPSSACSDWVRDELQPDYSFAIEYHDRSWLDLRLNNTRQDLRRQYFGIELERHTLPSLLRTCQKQVREEARATGVKYIRELYVTRGRAEEDFRSFLESDKRCFVVVDASGSGKTNLLCQLAESYSDAQPVLLLGGRNRLEPHSGLLMRIADELGYAAERGTRLQHGMEDFIRVLQKSQVQGIIFIDGVSENEDIFLMKQAILELLRRYAEAPHVKICLTCRDTLWYRFLLDFPSHLVYRPGPVSPTEDPVQRSISTPLGRWTDDEFSEALRKYQEYFDAEFELTPDAANRCRHPLVLRLLCDAYSGRSLGLLDHLPTNKLFEDYLDSKVQRVADYFALRVDPSDVRMFLMRCGESLWEAGDAASIPRREALKILDSLDLPTELYPRLLDEGILFESKGEPRDERPVGFLFDELGDYILYLHLMAQHGNLKTPTSEMIAGLCSSVGAASPEERSTSEKLLELLSGNLDDVSLQDHLLEQALQADLHVFSKCANRKLAVPNLPDDPEPRASEFGQRLLRWYWGIVELYFSDLKYLLDPYPEGDAGAQALGVDLWASPGFREVSYCYRGRDAPKDRVQVTLCDEYPTFGASIIVGGDKEFKLHDPDGGIVLSILRDPSFVRRVVNSELGLPFPGVSLYGPERIAKQDVWNELANLIEQQWFAEPLPLIEERAVSLINELRCKGIEITTSKAVEQYSTQALAKLDHRSREYIEMSQKLGRLALCLSRLNDTYDLAWLPEPDLEEGPGDGPPVSQLLYSRELLREYVGKLVVQFMKCYRSLVQANFETISNRMNLFSQWPVSVLASVPASRDYVRITVVPEADEAKARVLPCLVPADVTTDIASATIGVDGDTPVSQHVDEILRSTGRMSTSTHLIDVILPMSHLFEENPLNYLTYGWLKAELGEVMQVPYPFWR